MTSVSEPRWPMRKSLPATSPRPTPKATPYLLGGVGDDLGAVEALGDHDAR